MKRHAWFLVLVVGLMLFAGVAPVHASAPAGLMAPALVQDRRYDYLQHTLKLPDGRVLYPGEKAKLVPWNDLQLMLVNASVKSDAPLVQTVVGNHTIIRQTEDYVVPAGKVTFADVERTPPAASGLTDVTREYWLIKFRDYPGRPGMVLAYAIQAVVTGDPERARQELLRIAQGWKLPTR